MGDEQAPKIATASFKRCLEESKIGKDEQAKFEKMKREMEQSIERKEAELKEMAPKFSDEYLDALTPEAEAELKKNFQELSQQVTQERNQYMYTLNQLDYQIVQKIYEKVVVLAKDVANQHQVSIIFDGDRCLYRDEKLDLSDEIIAQLDAQFDLSQKEPSQTMEVQKPAA